MKLITSLGNWELIESLLPDEILALTIYGEARGETIEGQIAVANVIMNRWKGNSGKYKSVKEVCLEKNQFSCWNKDDPNRSKLEDLGDKLDKGQIPNEIKQELYIARGVLGYNFYDNTKGSLYYMTTNLLNSDNRPKWANNRSNEIKIGNHTFFNV